METGRNDPCPCGSGKKFKKCCLVKQDISFDESSVLLEAERRLNDKIFAFYQEHCDAGLAREVGRLLFGNDFTPDMLYRDQAKEIMFNQFAIFDYRPSAKHSTLFEKYHVEKYFSLDPDEQRVINGWRGSRWGLFEIQEVFPGKGSYLDDVFTEKQYNLRDIASSQIFKQWDILFVKISPLGSVWRFCVLGLLEGQRRKSYWQEFILSTFEEYQKKKKVLTLEEFLQTFPHLVINAAFTIKPQLPKVVTHEGDEMEVCKTLYKVKDFQVAAKTLAENIDFVIDETEKSTAGNPVKYSIGWRQIGDSKEAVGTVPGYRPQNFFDTVKGPDEEVVRSLGHIVLEPSRLTLECVTRKRLAAGKKRIEALLKGMIRHDYDEFKPFAQAMEEYESSPEANKREIPDEVNELIAKQMESYSSKWADMSIPMLSGLSPREASMTEAGEELLEELLKYMENLDAHASKGLSAGISVPASVLKTNLARAKKELVALINGDALSFNEFSIENNGKDFLEDFNAFLRFIGSHKVKLTPKQKFIPDEQVRSLNETFKVKERFAITFNGKSIDLEKKESNKQRLYLIDSLARNMGAAFINSKNILEFSPETANAFQGKPEISRLWRLFAVWWYQVCWNQSLPGELGKPENVMFDTLFKKVFVKALLEKCSAHYSLKELVEYIFKILGKTSDGIIYFGPLVEKCVIPPLEWFGCVEVRKCSLDLELGIPIDDPSMQKVDTLKITIIGKEFLSKLILCAD